MGIWFSYDDCNKLMNNISMQVGRLYDEYKKNEETKNKKTLEEYIDSNIFANNDFKYYIDGYTPIKNYYSFVKKNYEEQLKRTQLNDQLTNKNKEIKNLERIKKEKENLEIEYHKELKRKNSENEKIKKALENKEKELLKISKEKEEEIEKKKKEYDNKMRQWKQDKSKLEQNLKDKSLEAEKKIKEERKKLNELHEKEMQDLENKIKQEFDEEKRKDFRKEKMKMWELKRKRDKINKVFNNTFEKKEEDKVEEILKLLKEKEKEFCLEDISKYREENIPSFIVDIFKNEEIISDIIGNLKIFVEDFKKKILNIQHLNIILVGPSGVGKSTLINAILKTNAKVNFGRPETTENIYYESEEIPFLRLADSRGIEKSNIHGVAGIFESIKGFINDQIESNNPDKFIHCIWYCWTGTRLEENEIMLFKELSKQYSLDTIPIIIVYTNAIDEEQTKKAKEYIKNELKLDNDFIEILAQEKKIKNDTVIPPFNLEELKNISIKRAKEAIQSSCYEGLLNDVKKSIKNSIGNLMNNLKEKINVEAEEIISEMTTGSKIEDLDKETTFIIMNIFYHYYFLSPNININKKDYGAECNNLKYTISKPTQSIIQEFSVKYFENTTKIYQKKINELIENHSKQLSNDILVFQNDFNKKNDNLLDVKWTSLELENSLKNYLYEKISKEIELNVLKNSFRFIITPLIKNFGMFFEKSYAGGMERDEFITYSKNIIKVSFEANEQKIKEYNELQNKKKEQNKIELETKEPAPTNSSIENIVDNDLDSLFDDYNKKKNKKEKEKVKIEEEQKEKINSLESENNKQEINNNNNNKELVNPIPLGEDEKKGEFQEIFICGGGGVEEVPVRVLYFSKTFYLIIRELQRNPSGVHGGSIRLGIRLTY